MAHPGATYWGYALEHPIESVILISRQRTGKKARFLHIVMLLVEKAKKIN